jgi:D-3-phosphoglycerate dehydrogenase
MANKVLFLDTVHSYLFERLSELGYECDQNHSLNKEGVEELISDYCGIVIRSRFSIDQNFLDQAINLKFIARSGAGLENIDVVYAEEKGVKVFNSPEGNKDAVGEHALGMLLMLFNQLQKGDKEVRNAVWDREGNRGIELSGKTVGIIGYGNMGASFAEKLGGFGCRILAYDKYKTGFGNEMVEESSLEELFQQTDVLSIHLPLSEETHHFVNEEFLSKFSKSIYLVNTARGNNVNLSDLVDALKTGKVTGACLDVLEYESKSFESINTDELPEAFQYLKQSEKVIFSPHVAGWTQESYRKLSTYLADKIEREFH